jgi:hypothetical protein
MMVTSNLWYGPEHQGDRGQAMVAAGKALAAEPENQYRNDTSLTYARMYEGRPITSLYQFAGGALRSGAMDLGDLATWNVLRAVCGSASAQVCRSRPRPRFLTNNGNQKQKTKAKKLQAFADGLFVDANVYEITQQAFTDATVFPNGWVQVYVDHDRVKLQRCLDGEIFIEWNPYGAPRTIYRRRYMDRYQLLADFGDDEKKADAIRNAHGADLLGTRQESPLIEVWESWRLPSRPNGDDGFHVIALDHAAGGTLLCDPWTKSYWPLINISWELPLAGSHGTSVASIVYPIQYQINAMLLHIEKAQRVACRPRMWVRNGSKAKRLTNEMGEIIESAEEPRMLVFGALSPEIYQQLERHIARAYELSGVSREISQGVKPTGTNSAVAIRESLDVAQARFALVQQRWENMHVRIAKVMIDMARDLYKDSKKYQVSAPGTQLLESIDWSDIDLTEDEYFITVQPASLLPTTPAGRIDTAQDLVKSGVWSADRAQAALDELDPESEMSLERAAEKNIERQIELMLDGQAQQPDKFTDFGKAIKLCSLHINQAEIDGVSDKSIDLVRRYADACFDLQKAAQAASQPANDNARPPSSAPVPAPVAA